MALERNRGKTEPVRTAFSNDIALGFRASFLLGHPYDGCVCVCVEYVPVVCGGGRACSRVVVDGVKYKRIGAESAYRNKRCTYDGLGETNGDKRVRNGRNGQIVVE